MLNLVLSFENSNSIGMKFGIISINSNSIKYSANKLNPKTMFGDH